MLLDGVDVRELEPRRGRRRRRRWCPSRRSCSTTPCAATSRSACRRRRRGRLGGAAARPGRRLRRRRSPTGSTPRSASAARRCPAASASASRWPARWSAGRGCSSSTTRPPASTRRSRRGSCPGCATPRRSTVVVVAYRKATIALADEVVYVEHGRVVDRGTHDELLARCDGLPGPGHRLRARAGRARPRSTTETDREDDRVSAMTRDDRDGDRVGKGADSARSPRSGAGCALSPEFRTGLPGRSCWPWSRRSGGHRADRRAADHRPRAQRPAGPTSAYVRTDRAAVRGRRGAHRAVPAT